ncbi:MAG TPA: AarF/UbiB family protein [Candidatus Dormibacteraeota bacterium]|nr:AarF/UbiB family protein [Candidatus Dormibacteraeota bacterium]
MKLSPHYLKRYKDLTVLALKYSRPGMTSRFAADEEEPPVENGDAQNGGSHGLEHDLPDDLERLGPTFVKLGQLLSSRVDLLPPRYLKPLSRLQDRVKPFPFEDVQTIVEAELGTKLNKAFSQFEREPVAAASLGQVHRAALHDGRLVVVKVQRPYITKQIQEDFDALEEIARFLHRHTKIGQRYQIKKILAEFENTLAHELDYRREAANLTSLARNLKNFERIRVPLPVDDYTTRKILTMEYIEGSKITELSPLARLDFDGHALAEELFQAYLKQVLADGLFHADPHPGNIFMTPDHKVALLDLGMVGHTTPSMQENLLKLLLAVSEGESDEAADVAIRISDPTDGFNEMDFRHHIGELVAEQQNSSLEQMDIGRVILAVGRTAADTGLYVPPELSLLGKTLLQLDQVGRTLDPEFDPNESIRRNASALLNQRLKSSLTEGKLFSSLLEAKEFASALPTRLNKILDAVGNAELNVNVKPSETKFLMESAQKVANRITTGLILAALIVGAALLMRVQTDFQIFGYPGLAMLCFMGAGGGGFWLLFSILWQDHKTNLRSRR